MIFLLSCLLAVAAYAQNTASLPPPVEQPVDFTAEVRPLFEQRCYGCHGAAQQMGGLRLDRKGDALRGGNSGAVIMPGDSARSKLVRAIAGVEGTPLMPMVGERLTPEQIGVLRAWIDQGAEWPDSASAKSRSVKDDPRTSHWSFQPIRLPSRPKVGNEAWVKNAIDAFVLAHLDSEGLEPSPPADRATLVRRLSLDIIGLPPSPQEVSAFLADQEPGSYERLVKRLSASPYFGEKWARHWLDLARYADSDGYSSDRVRPYMWRYREWVVNALNQDMPFDRFTAEQLAGDLLPNATVEQRVAPGFYRCGLTNREAGVDLDQIWFDQVVDRTRTVGEVWLGLSVGCAQCHDHKYDPISQKDFYQLFAFFNRLKDVEIDAPLPGQMGPYLLARPEYERKRQDLLREYCIPQLQAEWEQKLLEAGDNPGQDAGWDFAWTQLAMWDFKYKVVRTPIEKRSKRQRDFLTDVFVRQYALAVGKEEFEALELDGLQEKLKKLDEEFPKLTQAMVVEEDPNSPRTYVAVRGNYKQKGAPVEPDTLSILPPMLSEPHTRLELARWLVSDENPLTARVTVNRVWQELFGRGLVLTSEDFGKQGEKPSHPALLDELAFRFRREGWSLKRLIRRIVASNTYRQSSAQRPELEERDPNNVLLARQSRLRLPAELIRDATLAASGLLNPDVGGPPIKPPLPPGAADLAFTNASKFWEETQGPDRYRRGIYIHFQRLLPYPQLLNFDIPNAAESCSRRERSNTPLQSLNLLNDPVFFEAAQALAARILLEAPPQWEDRLRHAFQVSLSRDPAADEARQMRDYFQERVRKLDANPQWASSLFPNRLEGVDPVRAAAWVGVSRILLNLDEFITRD